MTEKNDLGETDMSKIKHIPYGVDPYISCGYDRIPLSPAEGTTVKLRCLTNENHGNPELDLRIGRKTLDPVGYLDPQYGKNCYCFSVGPFHAGERVRYTFRSGDDKTREFSFTVRKRISVDHFLSLWTDDRGKIFLACDPPGGVPLALQFEKAGSGLSISAVPFCGQVDQVKKNIGMALMGGFRAVLSCSHKYVTLLSPDGLPILSLVGISVELDGTEIARFHLDILAAGKGIFGFGEKYDRVNQKGLKPKNVVYEHFTRQGKCTYMPVPWLFSEAGWGIYCDTGCAADFDLSEQDGPFTRLRISAETGTQGIPTFYVFTGTPCDMLKEYQKLTGPCSLPPRWAFGPWMSSNGWNTQKEVMQQVARMKKEKIPATVLVLEAWSDESTFYIFNGAKYQPRESGVFHYSDFSYDPDGPWPNPKKMMETLKKGGLHLILWQIPALKNSAALHSKQLAIDEREMIQKGYCVKTADGKPYRIPDKWFQGSLVPDFTNPQAKAWWLVKRRYLVDELGVEGFKTDGGEFIYDPETIFFNGLTGADMRNPYPMLYTNAYYSFLQENGHSGITFSRAGYAGSQKCPLHWAGDQISTFEEMRSQLRAGLSAGLSGIPFWGFDMAGFAGELPDAELYLRAAELATFCPVMQFHSEPRSGQFGDGKRKNYINDRTPWNIACANQAPQVMDVYRKYAELRIKLIPYIYEEAQNCVKTGRPLLCHLVYEYPDDASVINIEDEYLFGRNLLVAPVLERALRKRRVYLPKGKWRNFWTGTVASGEKEIEVSCPLDTIPVFWRMGWPVQSLGD